MQTYNYNFLKVRIGRYKRAIVREMSEFWEKRSQLLWPYTMICSFFIFHSIKGATMKYNLHNMPQVM